MLTPARTQAFSTVESPKTWKSGSTQHDVVVADVQHLYRQRAVHVELEV